MKSQIIKFVALLALLAGCFSCTKGIDDSSDEMVSIKLQCANTNAVDTNIISFELPGIVEARCYELLSYENYGGIPGAFSPHIWLIRLGMAKGTDVTKLAPIITLAPGAKITPESGTVLDFSDQTEWEVLASDGSSHHYFASAFIINY